MVGAAAAAVCALAAWVSCGMLALDGGGGSARLGMLPALWLPAVVGVGLVMLACWKRIPARAWWPALVPGLLLLPWLPVRVPGAFLLWTGPVTSLVWLGTGLAVAATVVIARVAPTSPAPARNSRASLFGRGGLVFALSLALYAVAAWSSSAVRPAGDEPHYLVIAQSLLIDRDLQIENNHQRKDYAPYYRGLLRPDFLRRGRNGQIYSVHAPGLPALVAPAFAVGGYPGVVIFLLVVSALGAWLVWSTSLALTGSLAASWFGWAAVCLSVPFLCHSGAVFPDGPGAVLVATGVAALVKLERTVARKTITWFLHGLALAALPWLHTRFAAAAGILGACIGLRLLARRERFAAAAFAVAPLVSAVAWFAFFRVVYGTFSPAAPYAGYSQSDLGNLWPGFPALFFDQQFGLLPNAPVYAIALAGLGLLARHRRRLAIELALLLVVYLAIVASYHMWWGGWSAPARFAVPVLLSLGPCAAWFWSSARRAGRSGALVALTLSLFTAAVVTLVGGGRLMFNDRDGVARWLEWLCPVADLPRALPSFFRGNPAQALGDAAVWCIGMALAWWALRAMSRGTGKNRGSARGPALQWSSALPTVASLLFALTAMSAATAVWSLHAVVPGTPTTAQLRMLASLDPVRLPTGVRYNPLRLRAPADLVTRMRLSTSQRRPLPLNAPALTIRELPAGTYRIVREPSERRTVDVGIWNSTDVLTSCAFDAPQNTDCLIHLPVNAREVHVAFRDAATSSETPGLELQPLDVLTAGERLSSLRASSARRYGPFTVFAFDNGAFLEPGGLWVSAAADVPLVLASDAPRPSLPLLLRNGARPNTIHLRGTAFSLDIALASREERIVAVPLGARTRAVFLDVRADNGFKPSETEGSRDERYLGVWLEMPGDL